jgi:hypothetical protein
MNNVVREHTNLLLRLFVFSSGALDDFDGNDQSSSIGSSVDNAVAPNSYLDDGTGKRDCQTSPNTHHAVSCYGK